MNRRIWLIAMPVVAMFRTIFGPPAAKAGEKPDGRKSHPEAPDKKGLPERVTELERQCPPVGTVLPYAGTTLPPGWLWCNGQQLDLKMHPEHRQLAELLGTRFRRSTDPKTTCRLPDLQGRVAVGAGTGVGLSPRVLGTQDGHEAHTLALEQMPNHHHYVYRHAGAITGKNSGGAPGAGSGDTNWEVDDVGDDQNGRTTGVNGKSRSEEKTEAFGLMQPFLALNFIIRF
jgi:microcystin-dependent protein